MLESNFLKFFNSLEQGEKIVSLAEYLLETYPGSANGIRKLNYNEFYIEPATNIYETQLKIWDFFKMSQDTVETILDSYFDVFYRISILKDKINIKDFIEKSTYGPVILFKGKDTREYRMYAGIKNLGRIYKDFDYCCNLVLPYDVGESMTISITRENSKLVFYYDNKRTGSLEKVLKFINDKAYKTFQDVYKLNMKEMEIDKALLLTLSKDEIDSIKSISEMIDI